MSRRSSLWTLTTWVSAVAWVLALGGAPAVAQDAPVDPFATHRESGNGFSIRFKDGRSVFQMREPIEVELVFNGSFAIKQGWETSLWTFDRNDVVTPGRAIDRAFDDSLDGGVTCDGRAPAVMTRVLNDAVRFDVPGRYRVFVRSRHLIQIGNATGEPETSNVLSFQILERDPSREAGVAARVARVLDNPGSREATRAALSELSILGTRQAGALLARELRKDRGIDDVIFRGLYTVDDRASAVRALERELQKPDRTVDAALVRDLAMLELARRHPAGPPYSHADYLATIRKYSTRRARALNAQPHRLQAEIARELGDHRSDVEDRPSGGGNYFLTGVLAPALYRFPAETTAAFLTLGAEQQHGLLIASWPHFAHVRFLPLLRTLYTSSKDEAVRGAALRRLAQLAPLEGRTAIMAELRRPLPRVPTAALLQLRDRTLPALERIWVGHLERARTDEHRASAAQRIQRYGTGWSGPRVARFYARNRRTLSAAAKAPILAHLSRVDPAALPDLREALSFWPDRYVDETLLEQVADLEWQPVTERATIEALYGSDPGEVERAARVLSRHGTPQAREPIHARLRQLQAALRQKIAQSGPQLDRSPEWGLEEELAMALAHARGWLLPDDAAAKEAAQCVNPRCAGVFERNRYADPDAEIRAYGPVPGNERHVRFMIGPTDYDSIEALERKLTQFAPGTRVFWGYRLRWSFEDSLERWTWPERNALFERVRASAARHGVTIQRERTYKRP